MTTKFPFEHFFKADQKDVQPFPLGPKNEQLNEIIREDKDDHVPPRSLTWGPEELLFLNQEVLKDLQAILSPKKFTAFFESHLRLTRLSEAQAFFSVSSSALKEIITSQYITQISEALRKIIGKKHEIIIEALQPLNQFQNSSPQEQLNEIKSTNDKNPRFNLSLQPTKDDLISTVESKFIKHVQNDSALELQADPKKTFSNYVVGTSNNLAFATAQAVAECPNKNGKYPCLYLYGSPGLGKTHLLHAIGNEILKRYPNYVVALLSAREFLKELVEAFKTSTLKEFQKKYCENVDVLMIDDIHELKNKEATLDEFFHLFNELHAKGKQLIFTSDKPPQKITGIEERIISRLQWGLVIDIQKPDLETRIAILKIKAHELDIFVPDDVFNLIASSIKTNIRELEGALMKLSASAEIMDIAVDIEMAKEVLRLNPVENEQKITIESIATIIAQHYRIPIADLKSKSRSKNIVQARHVAWYFSKKLMEVTLKEIASYYGRRDHSTITHGVTKIRERVQKEEAFKKSILKLEKNL